MNEKLNAMSGTLSLACHEDRKFDNEEEREREGEKREGVRTEYVRERKRKRDGGARERLWVFEKLRARNFCMQTPREVVLSF